MRTWAPHCVVAGLCLAAPIAGAADADESDFFGLLRARDLTPFGFLRLDMRPTHARVAPEGGWGVEMELGYQNTWALSPEVESYLGTLEGRREIGPAELEVDLLTVHTTGGAEMLRAAAAAAENRLALLGVTLLTSLSPTDVEGAWARPISSLREEVVRLATLARDCGLPGIVTSPQEAEAVRRRLGPDLVIVTPGIRMAGGDAHDQSRIATPGEAARAGATYLVIGRPVTAARDPVAAMASVRAELDTVGV